MGRAKIHEDMGALNKQDLIAVVNNLLEFWESSPKAQKFKPFFRSNPGRIFKNFFQSEFDKFTEPFFEALPENCISKSKIEEQCISFLSDLVSKGVYDNGNIENEIV